MTTLDPLIDQSTLDRYIGSFERSVDNLPNVFYDWQSTDPIPQAVYTGAMEWFLFMESTMLEAAATENRLEEITNRLERIKQKLYPVRRQLYRLMNIDLDKYYEVLK